MFTGSQFDLVEGPFVSTTAMLTILADRLFLPALAVTGAAALIGLGVWVTQRLAPLAPVTGAGETDPSRAGQPRSDLAAAAHDLLAPLIAIRGHVELFREDHGAALPSVARSRLDRMQALCTRGATLIEALRVFDRMARPDAGATQKSDPTAILARLAREAGWRIEVETPLPPVAVSGDRVALLFSALIENAHRYNIASPKEICLGFTTDPVVGHPDAQGAFYVRDNGIGIAPRYHDMIFAPCKRLHHEEAFGPGAGMGLATVRRIAEQAGGAVTLRSAEGQGTTFFVSLPQDAVAPRHTLPRLGQAIIQKRDTLPCASRF